MTMAFTALTSALSSVGLGAGSTVAGSAAAGAAGSAFSLSSILKGVATVGGMVSEIAGGMQDADAYAAQAIDAKAEIPFETLQGISRRASLKSEAADALGNLDVATAAAGVDLSVGSAVQARKSVYREADKSLTTDAATQEMRVNRLEQRARQYNSMARRAKMSGFLKAIIGGAKGFSEI